MQKEYICTNEDSFQRLDHVLVKIFPELGLRARRRLCEQGKVYINDKIGKAADKLKNGAKINIINEESATAAKEIKSYIIKESGDFAAIYKPPFVHSVALQGSENNHMEKEIMRLFPNKTPFLLNRLDYATSGILMLAFSEKAKYYWELWQRNHDTKKYYVTLVEGHLLSEQEISFKLDSDNKQRVKINKNVLGDRKTLVSPLLWLKDTQGQALTLVKCLITQGARHQIRAHLASICFPLVSDTKYGAQVFYDMNTLQNLSMLDTSCMLPVTKENLSKASSLSIQPPATYGYSNRNDEECFLLHHIKIEIPYFECLCLPSYLGVLPEDIFQLIENSLY